MVIAMVTAVRQAAIRCQARYRNIATSQHRNIAMSLLGALLRLYLCADTFNVRRHLYIATAKHCSAMVKGLQ
jgi:hypothetical protein